MAGNLDVWRKSVLEEENSGDDEKKNERFRKSKKQEPKKRNNRRKTAVKGVKPHASNQKTVEDSLCEEQCLVESTEVHEEDPLINTDPNVTFTVSYVDINQELIHENVAGVEVDISTIPASVSAGYLNFIAEQDAAIRNSNKSTMCSEKIVDNHEQLSSNSGKVVILNQEITHYHDCHMKNDASENGQDKFTNPSMFEEISDDFIQRQEPLDFLALDSDVEIPGMNDFTLIMADIEEPECLDNFKFYYKDIIKFELQEIREQVSTYKKKFHDVFKIAESGKKLTDRNGNLQ